MGTGKTNCLFDECLSIKMLLAVHLFHCLSSSLVQSIRFDFFFFFFGYLNIIIIIIIFFRNKNNYITPKQYPSTNTKKQDDAKAS